MKHPDVMLKHTQVKRLICRDYNQACNFYVVFFLISGIQEVFLVSLLNTELNMMGIYFKPGFSGMVIPIKHGYRSLGHEKYRHGNFDNPFLRNIIL